MTNLFLVTRGTYSEYHVMAVFTDRAKAAEYAALMVPYADCGPCDIEERRLDPAVPPPPIGGFTYRVNVGRDGSIQSCDRLPYYEDDELGNIITAGFSSPEWRFTLPVCPDARFIQFTTIWDSVTTLPEPMLLDLICRADNPEQAAVAAKAAHARFIAANFWPATFEEWLAMKGKDNAAVKLMLAKTHRS